MRYAPEDEPELPHLKRLRLMVMALIAVLMIGILAIAATIVIRLGFGGEAGGAAGISADRLAIPSGYEIVASGQGDGTVHLTLRDPRGEMALHIYDASTGERLSATPIKPD